MAYNIQMNYFDGSSYQRLYPYTLAEQISLTTNYGTDLETVLNSIGNTANTALTRANSASSSVNSKGRIGYYSYTGNGTNNVSITIGFQPQFIYISFPRFTSSDTSFSYMWDSYGVGVTNGTTAYLFFHYGQNASYGSYLLGRVSSNEITWSIDSSGDRSSYICNANGSRYSVVIFSVT